MSWNERKIACARPRYRSGEIKKSLAVAGSERGSGGVVVVVVVGHRAARASRTPARGRRGQQRCFCAFSLRPRPPARPPAAALLRLTRASVSLQSTTPPPPPSPSPSLWPGGPVAVLPRARRPPDPSPGVTARAEGAVPLRNAYVTALAKRRVHLQRGPRRGGVGGRTSRPPVRPAVRRAAGPNTEDPATAGHRPSAGRGGPHARARRPESRREK